jgi:thiol-disulfide isomerase/thioredoxin
MDRTSTIFAAGIVVLVTLFVASMQISGRSNRTPPPTPTLGNSPPISLDGVAPAVSFRRRDGTRVALQALERPTLVHFWATWCPPCIEELPGLLALSDDAEFDVLAVSLDKDWESIESFFAGRLPDRVVRGNGSEVQSMLGLSNLPASLLVASDGRLRLRFDGPRDWRDAAFVERWLPNPTRASSSQGQMRGAGAGVEGGVMIDEGNK